MSRNFQLKSTTAEAMIAQLCHDIAAPVSGIVTSSGLLFTQQTSKETAEVARELLSSSVDELLERLTYIREMCALDHELDFVDVSITDNTCSKLLALKEMQWEMTESNLVDRKVDADFNKLILWLIWFIYRSSIGHVDVKVHIGIEDDLYKLHITANGENFVFNEQKINIMLDESKDKMSHYNAEAFYIKDLLKEAEGVAIKALGKHDIDVKLSYKGKNL